MRSWKITLGVAAAVVATAFVFLYNDKAIIEGSAGATPSPAMMAMPVPVTDVVKKTIPIHLDYSARTESMRAIALQPKVSGYILKQHVHDGADVKKGDLLYTIDPRDFQAALDQAKALVARDAAALDYARSNLNRGTELAKNGFLAKDTFDQRASTLHQAQAALQMDQAAERKAEIDLSYTEIRAPFDGRLGRNQAPVGTLVGSGGTPLNTLVQLDPIYVTFNPSETDLAKIQKARAAGKVKARIVVADDDAAPHEGELTFLDNTVDRSTGTIIARATIANPERTLLPGQYVRIRLLIGNKPDALMVPRVALGSSQLGQYVYVVGKGNKADQHLVSLGPVDGDLVSVIKGVSPGDKIIIGNLQKIGPGAPVKPLPH